MKKSNFIFSQPTAEQINALNEKTANLVSQKLVNFPENGKCLKTKNPARKTTTKQLQALQSANEQRSLTAQVEKFVSIARLNYKLRLDRANELTPVNTFVRDSRRFMNEVKNNPEQLYSNLVAVGKLTNHPNPADFALQFAKNIAITNESDPNYVAQKELGKLPEFISALAENRPARNTYLAIFFIAMCEGMTDLSRFSLMYYANNKKYHLSTEVREKLRERGASSYTIGTAKAQSGQCKKLSRALGLITYKKFEKNTPVVILSHALPLFKALAGRKD